MNKRWISLLSLILLAATVRCFLPGAPVRVHAMSNAGALTPYVYKTGSYTALRNLNACTTAGGSRSAGFSVSKDVSVRVTSVSGKYGKVTSGGKSGWIDLSYAAGQQNKTDIPARLAMLREKFPAGMYWNCVTAGVNNPDGYSDQPCPRYHTDKMDNYFDGTCQCHGFAFKLGYDLFGIHASVWERHYDLDRVVPGDLIRYRSRHTVMVTGVYGDTFTVADCNYDCHCGIAWDREHRKDFFSFYPSDPIDGIYHCPANTEGLRTVSFTTSLSTTDGCTAYLLLNDECLYDAKGVTRGGKTTFTFRAPCGTYQELLIMSEEGESYSKPHFVYGTDTLPDAVTLYFYGDIDGDDGASDNITFTAQPGSVTVSEGSAAKLSAKAKLREVYWWYGSSDMHYRWFYREKGETLWKLWKGKDASSVSFTASPSWNGAQIICQAYTWYGDYAYSNPVRITVIKPVRITQQPVSVSGAVGDNVKFTVKATGTGLTCQWYYKKPGESKFTAWNKHTSASVSTPVYQSWNGAQFYCAVKDGSGKTVKTNTVTLTVVPKITRQPISVSGAVNDTVTFAVKATGSGLTYQWYYRKSGESKFTAWNKRTAASASTPVYKSWNGAQFYCAVKDGSGKTVKTNTVTLTVVPKITRQPISVSGAVNDTVTFAVKATGSGLTYQWYYRKSGESKFTAWNKRTAASASTPVYKSWNGAQFYCVVKDGSGKTVKSDTLTLTVR